MQVYAERRRYWVGGRLYESFKSASTAHARWGLQTSRTMLTSEKRSLLLGLMLVLVIPGSIAFAGDLPSILGGHHAYSPAFYSVAISIVSILMGLIAGFITGCIGAGGGFIITPALMSANVKGGHKPLDVSAHILYYGPNKIPDDQTGRTIKDRRAVK